MFGRINQETQAFEWAPVNFVTPDGETIMNFCFDEELERQYGFKQVETEPEPEVGPNQIAVPRYTDDGDVIRESWEIIDLEEAE